VNSSQSKTQSGENRQTEDHQDKDGQSEAQREVQSHETLPAKNNQTEQVQGSNARQETSPSQTYSDVTGGRSPPYNLRSTSNAPPKTLVRLLTVLFFLSLFLVHNFLNNLGKAPTYIA
jgi:hypothetical protein